MNVHPHKAGGRIYWVADLGVINGKRRRKVYRTRSAAEAAVSNKRKEKKLDGENALVLSDSERAAWLALRARAKAAGTTPEDAFEFYLAHRPKQQITIGKAVEACVASKRGAGRRERYVRGLDWFLTAFARDREDAQLSSIQVADVESWLATHAPNPGSRATWINRLSTLFSFAIRSGWIHDNPCARVERPSIEQGPPAILTPDQAKKALTWTRKHAPDLLGWLALGMFAGLRPEEADRMTWADINLDKGTLQVDAAASKVRQRRVVDLHPTAQAWLQVAKKRKARLPIPSSTRRRLQRELRGKLQLKAWPKDVLRHTAASYLLALHQDAPKVALWLGNSPAILMRHYRELVTAEASVAFWAITP